MSSNFHIYRFSRPTEEELKVVDYFSEYGSFHAGDRDEDDYNYSSYGVIRLFRQDDEKAENLVNSEFAVHMELPQIVTDYEKFYSYLGFSKESIKKHKVYCRYSNGYASIRRKSTGLPVG